MLTQKKDVYKMNHKIPHSHQRPHNRAKKQPKPRFLLKPCKPAIYICLHRKETFLPHQTRRVCWPKSPSLVSKKACLHPLRRPFAVSKKAFRGKQEGFSPQANRHFATQKPYFLSKRPLFWAIWAQFEVLNFGTISWQAEILHSLFFCKKVPFFIRRSNFFIYLCSTKRIIN